MIADLIYSKIDEKIAAIETNGLPPSVILINSSAYRHMQQELLEKDMQQAYGKIRSPHDGLRSYRGVQILTSHVIETVEVF